jgi:hypothetical protein
MSGPPDGTPGSPSNPLVLDPYVRIVDVHWAGAPYWITIEVDTVRKNFVGSAFPNGKATSDLQPDTGYSNTQQTAFDLAWRTFFLQDGSTDSDFTNFEFIGANRPAIGSTTLTGNWTAGSFSTSVGAGATITVAGPSEGFGKIDWSPGGPFVFKKGSPGSAASNDFTSAFYVPPPPGFGSLNTDWRAGAFSFTNVIYADSLLSSDVFSIAPGFVHPLLAECQFGTHDNSHPNTAGSVNFDYSNAKLSVKMTSGIWVDYAPVAASEGGFILMLGTPRAPKK